MRNGHSDAVHGGTSEKVEGYSDNKPSRSSAPITCRDVSREAALREVPGFVQAISVEDREYTLIPMAFRSDSLAISLSMLS
jgi:hypothetical protein